MRTIESVELNLEFRNNSKFSEVSPVTDQLTELQALPADPYVPFIIIHYIVYYNLNVHYLIKTTTTTTTTTTTL